MYNKINTLLEIVFALKLWMKTGVESRMRERERAKEHQRKEYGFFCMLQFAVIRLIYFYALNENLRELTMMNTNDGTNQVTTNRK